MLHHAEVRSEIVQGHAEVRHRRVARRIAEVKSPRRQGKRATADKSIGDRRATTSFVAALAFAALATARTATLWGASSRAVPMGAAGGRINVPERVFKGEGKRGREGGGGGVEKRKNMFVRKRRETY
jgi:hypothetical protein